MGKQEVGVVSRRRIVFPSLVCVLFFYGSVIFVSLMYVGLSTSDYEEVTPVILTK